ncbi:MAG: helix-turn-helix transcriptional regulator [Bacilli bacterium]|nr:helix-turn-helix transcriptional regulator [Bacilli bacterium]
MKNLKKIREKRKITQIKLAIEVEVSQEAISAYESGKALPSVDILIKLANYLNTSTDYLLGLTDNELAINNIKSNEYDELLSVYSRLTPEQKKDILTYAIIREKM